MKKLLITGFNKFLDHPSNPSEELIKNFNGKVDNIDISTWIFPVEYEAISQQVPALLEEINPDYVLNLGYASDRYAITPEIASLNYIDSESPDNKGVIIQNQRIIENAPNAFFTQFNWARAVEALKQKDIPTKISTSAGTYLCNYTSYLFQYHISEQKLNCAQGFVHIPMMDIKVLSNVLDTFITNIEI